MNERNLHHRIICICALAAFLGVAEAAQANRATALSRANIDRAIERAAGYIVRNVRANGAFTYLVNMKAGVEVGKKYNIVRHGGTLYAMGEYHRMAPGAQMRSAIERAGSFLIEKAVAPVPGEENLLAVWSRPGVTLSDEPDQVKLGGTGLGLVGLLSIEQANPGFVDAETLRRLGRFLVYMQKENGNFYSKYIPSEGGRCDEWISLYYPGEAALGLVMLYEEDPCDVWLHTAAKGIAYLASVRANKKKVEPDHWVLIATAGLMKYEDKWAHIVSKDTLLQHATQICVSILRERERLPLGYMLSGCFTDNGYTCPTATRLEGLLAALTFLPAEQTELRKRIEYAVRLGIRFLLAAQVPSGKFAGAFPRGTHLLPPGHPAYSRAANDRVTEIRIDYVQHALSALMRYKRLFF